MYREFYKYAFVCPSLSKKEDKNRMKCAKSGFVIFCGPKTCPLPGSWNHFIPQIDKEPEKQAEVKEPVIKEELLDLAHEKPQLKLPVLKIQKSEKPKAKFKIKQKLPYTPGRPNVRKGTVKRALVSFTQKNGKFARWGFDCILVGGRKKTTSMSSPGWRNSFFIFLYLQMTQVSGVSSDHGFCSNISTMKPNM